MVNKNPLSEEQKEAIKDFIADPKRKLGAFKEYIENLEQMMANGELPNTYIAFEIIENIMGGLEEGYSNDELLSALSDKLQDNYIKVPSVALYALLSAWGKYKRSSLHDMDASFGLLGEETRRPPVSKLKNLNKEKYLVRLVVTELLIAKWESKNTTLEQAIEAVSLQDGVDASYETIRKAWYKHKDEFNSELITKGLADIIR